MTDTDATAAGAPLLDSGVVPLAPKRVQLSRAKGWRMPENTVKVDRSTRWGNPFNATQSYVAHQHGMLVALHEPPSLGRALDLYSAHLRALTMMSPGLLEPLRGKNLACWCSPGALCHADVLLRLANIEPPNTGIGRLGNEAKEGGV